MNPYTPPKAKASPPMRDETQSDKTKRPWQLSVILLLCISFGIANLIYNAVKFPEFWEDFSEGSRWLLVYGMAHASFQILSLIAIWFLRKLGVYLFGATIFVYFVVMAIGRPALVFELKYFLGTIAWPLFVLTILIYYFPKKNIPR